MRASTFAHNPIVHTSCPHGPSVTTRFGDTVCDWCGAFESWSPLDVSGGIYGDGTAAWVKAQCEAKGLPFDDALLTLDPEWNQDVTVYPPTDGPDDAVKAAVNAANERRAELGCWICRGDKYGCDCPWEPELSVIQGDGGVVKLGEWEAALLDQNRNVIGDVFRGESEDDVLRQAQDARRDIKLAFLRSLDDED